MFWFSNRKDKKVFEVELRSIEEEIHRSKRFGYQFGVLIVEVNNSVPRGLSRVMPGKTVSFHVLERNLRGYDRIIGPDMRRYYVILPQTDPEGVRTVRERLARLAGEQNWGDISIGSAIYPDHGLKAKALLDRANADLEGHALEARRAAAG